MLPDPLSPIFFFLSSASMLFMPLLVLIIFYFIYRFITMSSTPFKAMQAIYVYVAALIGLIFVALGAYGIIEQLLSALLVSSVSFNQAYLVTPLAQIIVGLLIMVPHWMIGMHAHWGRK